MRAGYQGRIILRPPQIKGFSMSTTNLPSNQTATQSLLHFKHSKYLKKKKKVSKNSQVDQCKALVSMDEAWYTALV